MKKVFRFKIEYKGETYTAIYKGNRKIESKYVKGYSAWGDIMLPSQVKEKFISDMEKK